MEGAYARHFATYSRRATLRAQVKPLIWVESIIEKHSHSRVEFMIKAKAQFKRRSTANSVVIIVPVPADADTPKLKATMGACVLQTVIHPPRTYVLTVQAHLPHEDARGPILRIAPPNAIRLGGFNTASLLPHHCCPAQAHVSTCRRSAALSGPSSSSRAARNTTCVPA